MSCVVFTLKVTDSPSVAKRLMWPTSSATWQLTKVISDVGNILLVRSMIKAPELNTISFKCGTKNIIMICTYVIVAYLNIFWR